MAKKKMEKHLKYLRSNGEGECFSNEFIDFIRKHGSESIFMQVYAQK